MATRVRVRVHESGIQSMFVPGGGVNGYGQRVAATTTNNMRKFAINHMRTGRLLRSFRTSSQVRRFKVRFTTYSTEPHALYLHRGTSGQTNKTLYLGAWNPKTTSRRYPFRVPRSAANPRWHRYIGVPMSSVRGTRPTYFMSRALNQSLRRHQLV